MTSQRRRRFDMEMELQSFQQMQARKRGAALFNRAIPPLSRSRNGNESPLCNAQKATGSYSTFKSNRFL